MFSGRNRNRGTPIFILVTVRLENYHAPRRAESVALRSELESMGILMAIAFVVILFFFFIALHELISIFNG